MPLLTTTIGAYPKPDYVAIPDWFTDRTDKMLKSHPGLRGGVANTRGPGRVRICSCHP